MVANPEYFGGKINERGGGGEKGIKYACVLGASSHLPFSYSPSPLLPAILLVCM